MIEQLYKVHYAELNRFARSIAGNDKEAEDLLQETFARALAHSVTLERLAVYERRAWLYKVMRNILYDRRRRTKFETALPEGYDPWTDVDFLAGLKTEELLECLPPQLCEVVRQRYILGMTGKQIADRSGVPHPTVRYRLHTALRLLRKKLDQEKEGFPL
ncbi:RNA polymerase sigma-70 factor, ECF subfamily [Paenibacillus sp. yr247]|uniref:RNA polymerase sigma factor n=1 Tax=Paenibacillus sp. yr247 TaxID=1761880 RepID=UPI0008850F8F|nr:RNA polymerase sigma factor [Paenibacillus sp. yr247]SDN67561.1 RNA polymerase sigma-70 factor, ECF subfamily [Paenibacillus sp. yr247]